MNLLLALLAVLVPHVSEVKIEAENAVLVGVETAATRSGYSGDGYVTGFDAPEDSVRFTFDVEAGLYDVYVRVVQGGRLGNVAYRLDGQPGSGSVGSTAGVFADRKVVRIYLEAGTHQLEIQGSFDLDYLHVVPVLVTPPVADPVSLDDAQATPATRALFAFLKDEYGKHILSGQQELRDVEYITSTTGKAPAIAAGDLMDYSPSRWERGTRPNKQTGTAGTEDMLAWAGQDGIVSLAWHWNAPTDLIDSESQPWWRGFYTEATTFDFAAALNDPSSERYALMLRDIDAIAVQLKKYADNDVPVLWRPLHEAAGGWFWWGSKGADPYVQLWRLLHDRLVNHHGLHNLIWVYTHEPNAFAWYPGAEYVDVISRDIYASDPNARMESDWQQLRTLYGEGHLFALSESGTLPDPKYIAPMGIWWSWMALWSGDFVRGKDQDFLTEVFSSPYVLTRDELPDWRTYGTASENPAAPTGSKLEVFPNPVRGAVHLRTELATAGEVRVAVYDVLGRRVHRQSLGLQAAGVLDAAVDLSPLSAGTYHLQVELPGQTPTATIAVVR